MSIGATGSVREFTPAFREKVGSRIIKIADELSSILGWSDAEDTKTKGRG